MNVGNVSLDVEIVYCFPECNVLNAAVAVSIGKCLCKRTCSEQIICIRAPICFGIDRLGYPVSLSRFHHGNLCTELVCETISLGEDELVCNFYVVVCVHSARNGIITVEYGHTVYIVSYGRGIEPASAVDEGTARSGLQSDVAGLVVFVTENDERTEIAARAKINGRCAL